MSSTSRQVKNDIDAKTPHEKNGSSTPDEASRATDPDAASKDNIETETDRQSTPAPSSCRLLALPNELKEMIFRYLIIEPPSMKLLLQLDEPTTVSALVRIGQIALDPAFQREIERLKRTPANPYARFANRLVDPLVHIYNTKRMLQHPTLIMWLDELVQHDKMTSEALIEQISTVLGHVKRAVRLTFVVHARYGHFNTRVLDTLLYLDTFNSADSCECIHCFGEAMVRWVMEVAAYSSGNPAPTIVNERPRNGRFSVIWRAKRRLLVPLDSCWKIEREVLKS